MQDKVILTCAVTGNAPFNPRHPNFPVTPAQIADAVIESANAGASVAHIHVRDPATGGGSRDPALFAEVVDRVRNSGTDIVINLTAGLGAFFLPDPQNEGRALPESDVATAADRVRHLEECLPEIASLVIRSISSPSWAASIGACSTSTSSLLSRPNSSLITQLAAILPSRPAATASK